MTLVVLGLGPALLRRERIDRAALISAPPGSKVRGVQALAPQQRARLAGLRASGSLRDDAASIPGGEPPTAGVDDTSVSLDVTSNTLLDPGLALDSKFRRADVSRHVGREGRARAAGTRPASSAELSGTSMTVPKRSTLELVTLCANKRS